MPYISSWMQHAFSQIVVLRGTKCTAWLDVMLQGVVFMPAVLRPDAAVYALAVPHLQMRALACPAALLMFVAIGAFRGFKDTTYAPLNQHCTCTWCMISHFRSCVNGCYQLD